MQNHQTITHFFPIAIFGFFVYVMISSSLKMFTTFTISDKGISVYTPPFHTRMFNKDQIREIKLLSAEETRKIIEASILEQNSFSESADIVGYLQMIRKRSPAFRYFTITPTARVTTAGQKETITSLNVKSTGGSITLTMKDDAVYFLTPANPEKFETTFRQMHPAIAIGDASGN